jgi:hypothetical protein
MLFSAPECLIDNWEFLLKTPVLPASAGERRATILLSTFAVPETALYFVLMLVVPIKHKKLREQFVKNGSSNNWRIKCISSW